MEREVIFNDDIDEISKQKLKNIRIPGDVIRKNNYEKLKQVLRDNSQLESVYINIEKDGPTEHWNNFLDVFVGDADNPPIDFSKLIVQINSYRPNLHIDKLENIALKSINLEDISYYETQIPNLKNIIMVDSIIDRDIYRFEDITFALKYAKKLDLDISKSMLEGLSDFLEENNLQDKILLSNDGKTIVNLEKAKEIEESELSLNIKDLDKFELDTLRNNSIKLVLESTKDLSTKKLEELEKLGVNIKSIGICREKFNLPEEENYDVDTYKKIRNKLDELVSGISMDLPEKERFAEVYKRICNSIVYDTPAAYPETEDEINYNIAQAKNSRNLRNGLLEGKSVCAGYASVLKNALAMVGIESKYIIGIIKKEEVPSEEFKKEKLKGKDEYKEKDGIVYIGESHAWNKVKLDGIWYNVDATWDTPDIRKEKVPTHCLKTDEQIIEKDKKVGFYGPKCVTKIDNKQLEKLFNGKHIYIGNVKIPNFKDFTEGLKELGRTYIEIGKDIKKGFMKVKERVKNTLGKKENLLIGQSNTDTESLKKDDELKSNPWSLDNYGIEKEKFLDETKRIASNNEPKKDNEENSREER